MSQWHLYFHLVWATKYRQPLLTTENEETVFRCALQMTKEFDYELLAINGMPDHVHLLLRTGPQFNLSGLVQKIKGVSSARLNALPEPKERFRWQEGYYAITVTPSHLPKVQAYVEGQKEHHRTGAVHAAWEETGEIAE